MKKVFFVIIFIGLFWAVLIVWQLGIFKTTGVDRISGWQKLQPLPATRQYLSKNGTFTIIFLNNEGRSILLDSVTVKEKVSNNLCDASFGQSQSGPASGDGAVAEGNTFNIHAVCNQATKVNKGRYEMYVTIDYRTVRMNKTEIHEESGIISGPAE
jgi:hypothetical protein